MFGKLFQQQQKYEFSLFSGENNIVVFVPFWEQLSIYSLRVLCISIKGISERGKRIYYFLTIQISKYAISHPNNFCCDLVHAKYFFRIIMISFCIVLKGKEILEELILIILLSQRSIFHSTLPRDYISQNTP